jgi:hypothetical protein
LEAGLCQGPSRIQRAFDWFCWALIRELSSPLQTELAIDTNMTVTNTNTVVTDTKTMVTDAKTIVTDTKTMVEDIHRNLLTEREDASGKNHSVGPTFYSSTTKYLPSPRVEPG